MYFGITDTATVLLHGLLDTNRLLQEPSLLLLGFANALVFFGFIVLLKQRDLLLLFLLVFEVLASTVSAMQYIDPNPNDLAFRYGFVATPFLLFFVCKYFGGVGFASKNL